eukprot:scaffold10068_cov35-Attheya_sp.AAC.1
MATMATMNDKDNMSTSLNMNAMIGDGTDIYAMGTTAVSVKIAINHTAIYHFLPFKMIVGTLRRGDHPFGRRRKDGFGRDRGSRWGRDEKAKAHRNPLQ